MKEIFANLFFFQALSSEKFAQVTHLKQMPRRQRFALLTGLFFVIFLAQYLIFISKREPNHFEILGLKSTNANLDEITQAYEALSQKYNPAFNPAPENLKKFKRIQEAYDCLKTFQCRVQYKKFGSYIASLQTSTGDDKSGSQRDPIQSMDVRMFTSIAFYFVFALLAAAMTSQEQKDGLRIALALAVVMCLSEVQWLNAEGMNESTEEVKAFSVHEKLNVLSMFSTKYCLFEKLELVRLIYFLVFDILCVFSKINSGVEEKIKQDNITKILENQTTIEALLHELYLPRKFKDERKPYLTEWKKKKMELLGNTNRSVMALQQGKDPAEFIANQNKQLQAMPEKAARMKKVCGFFVIAFMVYRNFVKK
ncbi:hypothetical protein FGO68_gene13693 [Halteria grandinella]|uniref:J domain-containing protein n=1 Tax=Halteria grandinella TaxID=5974 RepID=A0A8J8T0T4_HALGN|nr:hypothetical protein FGO68_gene13693 [Halteria grandinella]